MCYTNIVHCSLVRYQTMHQQYPRQQDHGQRRTKANVTIKIDGELVRDAKVMAARRGVSLSSLLADQLETLLRQERGYEAARLRASSRLDTGFDLEWTPPPSRDQLHER